jgi:hypothetical protein
VKRFTQAMSGQLKKGRPKIRAKARAHGNFVPSRARAVANFRESRNHDCLKRSSLCPVAVTVFRRQADALILNTIRQKL